MYRDEIQGRDTNLHKLCIERNLYSTADRDEHRPAPDGNIPQYISPQDHVPMHGLLQHWQDPLSHTSHEKDGKISLIAYIE